MKSLNELSEHHRRLEISSINEPARLKKELLYSIEKSSTKTAQQENLRQIQETLSALIREGSKLGTELRILESLRFQSMKARHSRIVEAHAKTFEWTFKTSFIEWLESHSGIYWVRGKAGSGKSTLMKFLWGHERTIQGLQAWAGQKKLVIDSYFFWNPGTEMQKSQEGLLQSLLYGILRQCPAMIPILCPSRWKTDPHQVHDDSWTRSELWSAFLQLKKHSIESTRFCFFIDGLDEYEGDHAEIVTIMEDLAALSDIKICLSSRPWNVFEDAFGKNMEQKLSLHEHTKEDIKLYIQNNLEEDDRFAKLITEDDRYQELVTDIMNKAQGVFLWVFLVVRSLLRGLTNSDTILDLEKRLTMLPIDLEKYFRHMLDSTEDVYHEQAAQIFQICLAAVEPPSLMTLSYFEEENPDYAFRMTIHPLDKTYVLRRCRQLQKRVKARCNDLLEITYEKSSDAILSYKVDFLHRTVRDFLQTKDMQMLLEGRISKIFDADDYLCKAYLAQLKCLPHAPSILRPGPLFNIMNDFMYHALRLEVNYTSSRNPLLEEFGRVISSHRGSIHADFWWSDWQALLLEDGYQDGWFVAAAIQYGLYLYVEKKFATVNPLTMGVNGQPLLDFALRLPLQSTYNTDVDPQMVQLLLNHGADPNQLYDGISIWGHFLISIHKKKEWASPQVRHIWAQTIEMLLHGGAKPDLRCKTGITPERATFSGHPVRYAVFNYVSDIIRDTCLSGDAMHLQELVDEKSRGGFLRWLGLS